MIKQKIKVSLRFAEYTDGVLSNFAGAVSEKLTIKGPVFTNLPVSAAELTALKTTFDAARALAIKGGSEATANKNAARAVLIDALTKDALYVQIVANNDLPIVLSSGYEAASTNRAQTILPQVQVKTVENAQSGQLKVRVLRVPNAKSFEGRIKPATGSEFGPRITFASSRKILFQGLTAGVNYVMQVCAIGGSTGRGDWSEPTSKMAL